MGKFDFIHIVTEGRGAQEIDAGELDLILTAPIHDYIYHIVHGWSRLQQAVSSVILNIDESSRCLEIINDDKIVIVVMSASLEYKLEDDEWKAVWKIVESETQDFHERFWKHKKIFEASPEELKDYIKVYKVEQKLDGEEEEE
jgi:hypothetical protein